VERERVLIGRARCLSRKKGGLIKSREFRGGERFFNVE
jgi:hypothetical protein